MKVKDASDDDDNDDDEKSASRDIEAAVIRFLPLIVQMFFKVWCWREKNMWQNVCDPSFFLSVSLFRPSYDAGAVREKKKN